MQLTDADWIKIVGGAIATVGAAYGVMNQVTSAISKVGGKIEELRDELAQNRWDQRIQKLERGEIIAATDIHSMRNFMHSLCNLFPEKQDELETLYNRYEERARVNKRDALEELEKMQTSSRV